VLIVDDDRDLAEALRTGFREEGFAVDVAHDGVDGLHRARSEEHDLMVLDLMLPGIDGFRIIERLRGEASRLPVLFLSARGDVHDRVRGLRLGGDDYLAKPFAFEELLARVRALLRRAGGVPANRLCWGSLLADLDAREATWAGRPLALTPKQFALLEALLLAGGRVVRRDRLREQLYDESFEGDSNVLDVHVSNLRRSLRAVAGRDLVETVRGVGFRLAAEAP